MCLKLETPNTKVKYADGSSLISSINLQLLATLEIKNIKLKIYRLKARENKE